MKASSANGGYPDVRQLTLAEAVAGLANGAFTALDLAKAYLARIGQHESSVQAWAWIDEDRMLGCAMRADARRALGDAPLLCGIPVGVKDIIHTAGLPTRMGSPVFRDFVPQDNAACLVRLEDAGAYVQGKTVSTEFATQHPGATRNPWDPNRTPGGSSSGSAAAVASGFTCAALGTQTRGSIVRPAAYCGVVGYKPSIGLISTDGVLALSHTLDHVGVLTRCVEDAGLLASVLVDQRDLANAMRHIAPPPLPPRLAALRTPAWSIAEPAQQSAFEAQRVLLERAAGHNIPFIDPPSSFSRNSQITSTIQEYEIARNFEELKSASGHLFSSGFRALCDRGSAISPHAYEEALGQRAELCRDLEAFLAPWDAIVTPSALGEALPTLEKTGDPAFCTPWTLCGVPAVSIPSGMGPFRMPLALQLVGRARTDDRVLRAASWCARQIRFNQLPLP